MNKLISKELTKDFFKYSNMIENRIKLKNLLSYNFNLIDTNTSFRKNFKNDLLIRLAKRTTELENLPYGLSAMPSINKISKWYIDSFTEIYNYDELNNNDDFKDILNNVYKRHTDTNVMISEGIKELNINVSKRYHVDMFNCIKDNGHLPFGEFEVLNNSLDNFYTNRLSVRLLIDQYINFNNNKVDYIGVINKKTNVYNVVNNAKLDALYLSERHYGDVPNIKIKSLHNSELCYIPSHLYFAIFEILKNSIRSVIESKKDNDITVIISGEDNIIIKITDLGTGIPFLDLEKIWYYSYTTLENNFYNNDDFNLNGKNNTLSPLAGFGIGLPLSRSIVRFLGGEITLMSIEGHGTDIYITLPKEI